MNNFFEDLKFSLEKIDLYRDKVLFYFIKPCWPRFILPNHLTYLRIIISVSLAVLLFYFNFVNKVVIIPLFALGALTDLFDGSVARGLDKETDFGAMLDPVADRMLILPIAVYGLYWQHRWLLLVLLITEVIHGAISLFYKSKLAHAKSNIFGKTRMVLLSVVFAVILVMWPSAPNILFIDLLWLSLVFSLLSMLTNLLELKKQGQIKHKIINDIKFK